MPISVAEYAKQISARAYRETLRAALLPLAKTMERDAKARAPRDRGRLRRTIRARVDVTDDGIDLVLRAGGPGVPYAAAQEYGATIVPRTARWLTIPISPAARYRSARSFGRSLFTIRSKAGNLLLVRRRGTGLEPLFVLKHRVRLPARPYMRPAVLRARRRIPRLFRKSVGAVVEVRRV